MYNFTKPIAVPSNFTIQGSGAHSTLLKKISTDILTPYPSISNPTLNYFRWDDNGPNIPTGSPAPGNMNVKDIQQVDAMFIIFHEDSNYNYQTVIKNIKIDSNLTAQSKYGIYAPRCGYLNLTNVHIQDFEVGFFTYNTWMSKIDGITITHTSQDTQAKKNVGFQFKNDGSGMGTGTSVNFTNCFVHSVNYGYNFFGLTYSSLTCCGSDYVRGVAYNFNSCNQITLNACASESFSFDYYTIDNGEIVKHMCAILKFESSIGINVSGFRTYLLYDTSFDDTNSACIILDDSDVNITSANFDNNIVPVSPNQPIKTFKIIIQQSSNLCSSFLKLPENGNPFVSFSRKLADKKSNWIKLDDLTTVLFNSSETSTSVNFPAFAASELNNIQIKRQGSIVFNTTDNRLSFYDGTSWINL